MIGVKIALIPFIAAFLFAEMSATVTGEEKVPSTTNKSFLTSLRFWERDRNQPQREHVHSAHSSPHVQPAETRSTLPRQPDNPSASSLATPGLAPEPPPIPYVERRGGIESAHLSEWSVNFHDTDGKNETAAPGTEKVTRTSHVSYSSDTRDWVESFPLQPDAQEGPLRLVAIQTTSLHSSAPLFPAAQSNDSGNEDENSYWNGQATKLATIASIRNEINGLQQNHTTGTLAPPEAEPAERMPVDMSPSYRTRLPHVQTCGVVVVQANFPLTEIASILEEINMLQHNLTRYIGVPAPCEKIELCLFRDQKSYLEFLGEFFPKAPRDRRALFVKLDNKPGTLMVQKSKDFEIDLRHEMTHAIIHASIPKVPIWLDEGLAKYFEVPPDQVNNHPYTAEIRRNARFGNVPSLANLTKLEGIDDMGTKEYRDAWAWTHFLIHRSPETHRLLAAYLQMLANWSPKETRARNSAPGLFSAVFQDGSTAEPIPSLKLYLDEMMPNQREAFREHFGAMER